MAELNAETEVKKLETYDLLLQCAEECMELAHVCLKMTRRIRGRNPTPVQMEALDKNLQEETADVLVCMDALREHGLLRYSEIEPIMCVKKERWKDRLECTTRSDAQNGKDEGK